MLGHHPPAKRQQLNGVSLAGRWWPIFNGILILSPPHQLKTLELNPSDKTFWIRAWLPGHYWCVLQCRIAGDRWGPTAKWYLGSDHNPLFVTYPTVSDRHRNSHKHLPSSGLDRYITLRRHTACCHKSSVDKISSLENKPPRSREQIFSTCFSKNLIHCYLTPFIKEDDSFLNAIR